MIKSRSVYYVVCDGPLCAVRVTGRVSGPEADKEWKVRISAKGDGFVYDAATGKFFCEMCQRAVSDVADVAKEAGDG